MTFKDYRNILTGGLMLVGLGVYGIVLYTLKRQSFKDALARFNEQFPDRISALRSQLMDEEGIDNGNTN